MSRSASSLEFRLDEKELRIEGPHRGSSHSHSQIQSHSVQASSKKQLGPTDSDEVRLSSDTLALSHIEMLVAEIQHRAADLDAREAQLNTQAALLEYQERQLRVKQQSILIDLEEKMRAIERTESELKRRARQIAFQ